MGSQGKKGDAPSSGGSEPPHQFASVPPSQSPMLDHSFTLQAILQNQQTLGELKGLVKGLAKKIDDQDAEIKKHGTIISRATGALAVVLLVGGFLIDKLWDKVSTLVTLQMPHQ